MAEKEISTQEAMRLLDKVTPDKAFHFYIEIGRPLGKSSRSLEEFANVVSEVDVSVVRFHLGRGDFESWFVMLGDDVLPARLAELRTANSPSADVRGKVSSHVRTRVSQLHKIANSRDPKPQISTSRRSSRT